jgi:hypothetical protein
MYYELATLDTVIFGGGKAAPAIEAWVKAGAGTLRGAWGTDLGRLNRVYLLRSFDDPAALAAERERALRSADPFGCADLLVGLKMESYKGADFRPGCLAGALGPVYEIRTYRPRIGALTPLLAAWEQAVPERDAFSKLAVVMYALDGPARWTQIWPYASLAERTSARAASVAAGVWPPKGGPDLLLPEMDSDVALPLPFSPLG